MVSTDGVPDEEAGEEEPNEESVLPPGPRRSTYTPPVASQPKDSSTPATADDDLEDGASEKPASTTGGINVIYQLDDVAPAVPEGVPVEQLPASPAGSRILLAEEGGDTPAMPTVVDPSKLPSPDPGPVSMPADLPPNPGEKPAPVFDLGAADPIPPTGGVPVAEPPVFEVPTTDVPVVDISTTDVPVVDIPPTDVPVVDISTTDVPVVDVSTTDAPAFEPPAAGIPTAGTPIVGVNPPDAADGPTTGATVFDVSGPPDPPFDEAAALAAASAPSGRQRWLPERQSLRDDELAALLENAANDPAGTLGAMEEFERQMKLREDETREFREWRETMLAVGTPEALAAVEHMGADFADMLPTTSSTPVQPATSSTPAQPPAQPPRLDAPPPSMPPPPSPPPSPTFDAPPPAMPPTMAPAPPPSTAPTSAAPPPFEAPPPLVEPPPLPDAWEMPVGNVIPGSETEFDEPVSPPPVPLVEPGAYSGEPFVDQVFTGSIPAVTGSVPIAVRQLDIDGDDPVDATDQAPAFDAVFGSAHPGTAPVEPILSPRIPEDEVVLGEAQELERPRVFGLERAGLEPTPEEQRIGGAIRMFWMWFAANSSIVSIGLGALVFSLGMSLRQSIVGVLAGVAVSFLPLGLGVLAGKRSGQPTMVVSRAVFGLIGNSVPAFIAVVSRVFWGAGMLWLLGRGTAAILEGAGLTGGLSTELLTIIGMAAGLVLALVVAVFGYGLIAIFQLVVTVISVVLVGGLIALTYRYVDLPAALTVGDGSWLLVLTAAVIVFSFIGLLWANGSGDLARYQRPGSSGAGAMLLATFGTAVPSFLLIGYGALLAASNEDIAAGLLSNPLDTIGRLLPLWYPAPLIAATALSLISGVVMTIYSGGFAIKALGIGFGRVASVVLVGLLVGAGTFLITLVGGDLIAIFRDLATTLAVPVAAWAGIFAADTMIRQRRYHAESLLRSGGVYPAVHWVNLPMLLVVTAVGFGLTTASVDWLSWQGYLFTIAGVPLDDTLAGTDLGVFAALLLGLLVPIVAGIPGIRRQEASHPQRN